MSEGTNSNETTTASQHGKVRDKAAAAIDRTRAGASHAVKSARKRSHKAADRAGSALDDNPIAVLLGGAAVGLIAGALIPRTQKESQVLGAVGKRLTETATAAAVAARDVGKQELSALTPDRSTAKNKAGGILGAIVEAATEAGRSAAKKR